MPFSNLVSYLITIIVLLFSSITWSSPQKPLEIVFWHSMAGQLGEQVRLLTQAFNQRQHEFVVKPLFKGNYTETLTSYACAFRAKHPPQLVQVFEVGSSAMLMPKGIVKPVETLMREQGLSINEEKFFPAVKNAYSENHQLMALPFNTSVPVMFYNADAIAAAGWGNKPFPQTWDELELLAEQLIKDGYDCAYTSAYPSWILIEAFSAIHGLTLFDGDSHATAAKHKQMVQHLQRLQEWQKKHYFQYGGRTDDATVLFTSGKCPIISQSSGSAAGFSALVPFHLGVAPIPLDTKISPTRHNNVVGGAAIWVSAGQAPEMERGIAQFLNFLSQSKTQQTWYQNTGYLPLEGFLILAKGGNQQKILSIAALDLNNLIQTESQALTGPQNQIRTINDQMLEAIFSTMTPPKVAMNHAIQRAKHAMRRFENNTRG